MGIARICGARRSPSGALAHDDAVTGPDPHANARDITAICSVIAAALIQPLEMRHLPVPAVEAKDRIGLCNCEPTFNIVNGATVNLTAVNILARQFAAKRT